MEDDSLLIQEITRKFFHLDELAYREENYTPSASESPDWNWITVDFDEPVDFDRLCQTKY